MRHCRCVQRRGDGAVSEAGTAQLSVYVCMPAHCVYLCEQIQLPLLQRLKEKEHEAESRHQCDDNWRRRGSQSDYPGYRRQQVYPYANQVHNR